MGANTGGVCALKYFVTGSSSETTPACASCNSIDDVNSFVTLAMSKIVSPSGAVPLPARTLPAPSTRIVRPLYATPTAIPRSSPRARYAFTCSCSAAVTPSSAPATGPPASIVAGRSCPATRGLGGPPVVHPLCQSQSHGAPIAQPHHIATTAITVAAVTTRLLQLAILCMYVCVPSLGGCCLGYLMYELG